MAKFSAFLESINLACITDRFGIREKLNIIAALDVVTRIKPFKLLTMSNTKQPPQELVEKMNSVRHHTGIYVAMECAQIAVDYAEEQNRELRDALIECIGYLPYSKLESKQKYQQILNK